MFTNLIMYPKQNKYISMYTEEMDGMKQTKKMEEERERKIRIS